MSFNKYILDIKALQDNAKKIKSQINGAMLCGVVKADAYAHNVYIISKNLVDYCDYFAVANFQEAINLRDKGITKKIIVLGIVPVSDVKYCIMSDISITLSSTIQLNGILRKLKELNLGKDNVLKIHLKVNSGLNRLGFNNIAEFKKVLNIIDSTPQLKIVGMYTHFATKSEDEKFLFYQYTIFSEYIKLVKDRCIIIHNNNSYASIHFPELANSMVRCGFALYGGNEGFEPVLSIHSEIIQINNVVGETVGYDRAYFADNKKIGVIPIGYADGYDRRLSNKFYALVNGKKAPIVGNICMDMTMLDITDIPDVEVGSPVVILGKYDDEKITVHDMAKALGTSEYEIMLKFKYDRMDIVEKN